MNVVHVDTHYVYRVEPSQFSKEKEMLFEGYSEGMYLSVYLWMSSKLEDFLVDIDISNQRQGVYFITLNEARPDLLKEIVKEFLDKAEV